MSSSILAMVTAFLKEIQLTGCNNITLDADNGKAIYGHSSDPSPDGDGYPK